MSKPFGPRLRELRIACDKSMGQVAREIGVTTVYYSQVENGKMPPFPSRKVSYRALADALGTSWQELYELSVETRGRMEINVEKAKPSTKSMLVQLGRLVDEDLLTEEQSAAIKKILGGD